MKTVGLWANFEVAVLVGLEFTVGYDARAFINMRITNVSNLCFQGYPGPVVSYTYVVFFAIITFDGVSRRVGIGLGLCVCITRNLEMNWCY